MDCNGQSCQQRMYKWVIITEISKEVENNTIGRLNAYQKNMCVDEMVPLEDHLQEVVVQDVLECCPCVYIHLFVLKQKRKGKQSRFVLLKMCRRCWCERPDFLILLCICCFTQVLAGSCTTMKRKKLILFLFSKRNPFRLDD
jgi:hypothetical protein